MKKSILLIPLLLAVGLAFAGCVRKTIVTEPPARRPAAEVKPKPAKKPVVKPAPKPVSKPKAEAEQKDERSSKTVESDLLYIQVGAFSDEQGAAQAHESLLEQGYKGSRLMGKSPADGFYRVQAGVFPDLECAQRALKKLKKKHPESFIIPELPTKREPVAGKRVFVPRQ